MALEIRHATADEIPEVVAFVNEARIDMFPMIDAESHAQTASRELANFRQTYLENPDGAFFVARAAGALVATIAYVFYDFRFPQLKLGPERVVEVVRLYVSPAWRRTGLASKLFAALRDHASEAGIQRLYLHTHPFLPGASAFWERQGFSIIHLGDHPVWQTIHMDMLLDKQS